MPLVYATPAHRGRGIIHLAERHPARTEPERIVLATSALCGASTAAGVLNGRRLVRSLRPGIDVAESPNCSGCLAPGRSFPTPGQPIPAGDLA